MVVRARIFRLDDLDGFVALDGYVWVGLVTFLIGDPVCEIISLDSLLPGSGIGTSLVRRVEEAARVVGCTHLRVVTTNDNTRALRFYQKLGFHLAGLRCSAVDEARRLKPSIPAVGKDGIPIRDEIELDLHLGLS